MRDYESGWFSNDKSYAGVLEEDLPRESWWRRLLGGGKHERDRSDVQDSDGE